MKKMIPFAFIFAIFMAGCTAPEDTKRLLETKGYTEIEITGYSWFSCSEDDTFQTGFEAVSENGSKVTGTVCSGLFLKGSTIRYD